MFDGCGPRDFLYNKIFNLFLQKNYPDFAKTPASERLAKFGDDGDGTYNRITGEAQNAAQACSEDIMEQLVEDWVAKYKYTIDYYLDPNYKHGRKVMVDFNLPTRKMNK